MEAHVAGSCGSGTRDWARTRPCVCVCVCACVRPSGQLRERDLRLGKDPDRHMGIGEEAMNLKVHALARANACSRARTHTHTQGPQARARTHTNETPPEHEVLGLQGGAPPARAGGAPTEARRCPLAQDRQGARAPGSFHRARGDALSARAGQGRGAETTAVRTREAAAFVVRRPRREDRCSRKYTVYAYAITR